MLYISLSAVSLKKVNFINKTRLNYIEYAESEFRRFEFVICKFIVLYEYKVNKISRNSKIIVVTCFNHFTVCVAVCFIKSRLNHGQR